MKADGIPVTREEDEWWADWVKRQEEESRSVYWRRQWQLSGQPKKA